jgi:hypothetical protein
MGFPAPPRLPGEGRHLCPDQQVGGQHGDLEPDLVLVEFVKGQVGQAGVLEIADVILGAGALTVPDFQTRDRPAAGVGGKAGDPPPVVIGES